MEIDRDPAPSIASRWLTVTTVTLRSGKEVRPMAEPAESAVPAKPAAAVPAAKRSDHSPWNWLLLVPIVLPLVTSIYNRESPELWGFPAFYWLQLLFILVGVVTTTFVYQMTRKRSGVSTDE
jgi:hypothetical protein